MLLKVIKKFSFCAFGLTFMKKQPIKNSRSLTNPKSILAWSKSQKKKIIANIVKLFVVLLVLIFFSILLKI